MVALVVGNAARGSLVIFRTTHLPGLGQAHFSLGMFD